MELDQSPVPNDTAHCGPPTHACRLQPNTDVYCSSLPLVVVPSRRL
jgi:hypothetical protein